MILALFLLEGGLLDPHTGTIFWVLVTFLIVSGLLYKLAWKPITTALEERERRIDMAIRKAEESKEEAAKIMARFDQILTEANEKADAIIKDARQASEKIRHDGLVKTKEETEKLIEAARAEIERDRFAMVTNLKAEMVGIIIQIAEKVIDSNLTDEKNKTLITKEIDLLSKN